MWLPAYEKNRFVVDNLKHRRLSVNTATKRLVIVTNVLVVCANCSLLHES